MPLISRHYPLRSIIPLGFAGFLAACATNTPPSGPGLPVVEEQQNYQAQARAYYAPPGPPNDPWGPYIEEASDRFDVPQAWIRAVMHQESGGHIFDHNGHFITSVPGAMGLMQIMPPSYDDLRTQYGLGPDAYNPRDNILAGTAYIRQMYDIYGSPGFLAAYNDGPGSIDRYLRQNHALPRETRNYVAAIAPHIAGIWPRHRSQNDLIVARYDPTAHTNTASDGTDDTTGDYVTPDNTSESQSVSNAWAARGFKPSAMPAPSASFTGSTRSATAAAWAARGFKQSPPPTMPHRRPPTSSSDDETVHIRSIPLAYPVSHHGRVSDIPSATEYNWGVQLGSYATRQQAHTVALTIHHIISSIAQQGKTLILPVKLGHRQLYRARFTGLSHQQATTICHRLSGVSPCITLSPTAHF
ncbi:transglycosylase SLT domain-containing protein [Saccharibacter sp. 17.LH.SD]|uniref:lytic transglycosylase domain-containing protein n=1 Tax=Saccharibacter sp. 17.LH.SD TaxID=2689393 RepID=UPI00136E77D7|nr:lytic transglycosylase domain-containing protein [Saccharibacter sp. 17.LH.SD]MXV45282.1 transglycosylase SLT domain-containing protein [Saccharibacter sp. 17.LH.SD]